ncbi:MAG TPA: serine/threonine-protein kinase [Kofleriaceae bacterium]
MDVMLGPYRVTGTIGRGGVGIVYAAEHSLLGRQAAIKVLQSELSQNENVVARFFNEARAATAIRHPGIIEIYDFGWTREGAAYLVMEFLEGETLGRRSARVPFRWPAVLTIARQIAGALAAAHAKGIVHRDLKPDNVFLVPDPEVPGGERIKLLDFGVAKLALESSTSPTVTRTGAVIGTPTYMAPEQCRGVAVDHRADLYALGCVIYELCCGRPPFRGEGFGDVLAAHIHMPVPAMSIAAEIPENVEALVRRLLAKAPGDRLQTAEEVIFAIDAVNGEPTIAMDPSPSMPSSMPSSTPAPTPSAILEPVMTTPGSAELYAEPPRRARLRWSVAAVAAGAVAITALVALMVRGDSVEPAAPAAAAALSVREPVGEPMASSVREAVGSETMTSVRDPVRCDPVAVADREPLAVDAEIDSAPAGAEVVLGGVVLGTTPFHGQIPRSDRDVDLVVRLAGYVERTIAVHASEPIQQRVTLARKPPSAPPKRAAADRDRSFNPFD